MLGLISAAILVVSVIIAVIVLCGVIGLAVTVAEVLFAFAPWILGVLVIVNLVKKKKKGDEKKKIEQK